MWSPHDIQRLRWTSLRAQYLKHEAWSETAKLTHSLQMINPSVPKCSVIAREEKRVLLWTVTDINCMCLNFIFTGFRWGTGGESLSEYKNSWRESIYCIITILFTLLYFQNVTEQTQASGSKIKLQQRGTDPLESVNISEVVCYM